MKKCTGAFRLVCAVLAAMAAGVTLAAQMRKLVRETAQDEGLMETLRAMQEAKKK